MTTVRRSEEPRSKTSLVILAWAFVAAPLAWGIMQTILKSLALFH